MSDDLGIEKAKYGVDDLLTNKKEIQKSAHWKRC
jgi:hypothetical protein